MKVATSLVSCGLRRRGSIDGAIRNTVRRSSLDGTFMPKRTSYHLRTINSTSGDISQLETLCEFRTEEVMNVRYSPRMSKETVRKMFEQPSKKYENLPAEMIFLGGAPGAGKGTNSLHVAQCRGHMAEPIVVSSLLNTPECKRLKDEGKMVDDAFVFDLLLKEVQKPIYRNGVVIDGFPRTAQQAEFLTKMHEEIVNSEDTPPQFTFVMLHVGEDASISRQLQRGESLKQENAKRVEEGLAPMELRVTDTSYESAKLRYTVFEQQLSAVMDLGKKFTSLIIDASSTIENVRSNISTQLNSLPRLS